MACILTNVQANIDIVGDGDWLVTVGEVKGQKWSSAEKNGQYYTPSQWPHAVLVIAKALETSYNQLRATADRVDRVDT